VAVVVSASADPVAAALVRADRQLQVASDALCQIAAQSLVTGGPVEWICSRCKHTQKFQGRCANRDCPSAIANAALESMRMP